MKHYIELSQELYKVKDDVIGIFKNNGCGVFELILKENDDTVDTVCLSSLGGVSLMCGLPKHYGKVILFPQGKNMNDMLLNPHIFEEFINQFN
jgi:hypothetical protein